ncbi:MAG: indolepyruvate ferredoxin oxidoreductase subunit beta [Archaeoglobaceae archaeon]|nr:indolepyruvate ferredoxin oxidoreductase subunit beta [Archaeoglobaceae archaeon]
MNFKRFNLIIVGVGGQGALTTAAILARAALKSGINVVTAETHGMAQRGGSVEVHVRFGNVLSPLIPLCDADAMIALEPSEALRYSNYLNENTLVILNTKSIIPPSVTIGSAEYPDLEVIKHELGKITKHVKVVDASSIAEKLGAIQATNVVVIGMLAKLVDLPIKFKNLEESLKEVLPEKLHEINLKALNAGYNAV